MEHVGIIGASPKPDRYSYKAQQMLVEYGHAVYPVSPKGGEVQGVAVARGLSEVRQQLDTITLYVGPAHQPGLVGELIAANPQRVIFNPGTESEPTIVALAAAGIRCQMACTLVLLRTGMYDEN